MQNSPSFDNLAILLFSEIVIFMINIIGNKIWCPIWSVIILVINKSDSAARSTDFVITRMITERIGLLSPVAVTYFMSEPSVTQLARNLVSFYNKWQAKSYVCCCVGGEYCKIISFYQLWLLMWIGHRKEVEKLTFWALALRRSESRNLGCVWFIYRKMELRHWLVPDNVKNNRIN